MQPQTPPSISIRTDVVKQIIASETPIEVITACRDLTNNELEFIRVHMQITLPAPRKPRKDIGQARPKADKAVAAAAVEIVSAF